MSAALILADRAAHIRAQAHAANTPGALARALASVAPLSPDRRLKISGAMKARDILTHGIVRTTFRERRTTGTITPCPDCHMRTRKISGHRPGCAARQEGEQ
jgi:hypothetical protein